MERVLTLKANYLASELGYEVHIVTTDQNGQGFFYPLATSIIHYDLGINYSQDATFKQKLLNLSRRNKIYKARLSEYIKENKIDICISLGSKEVFFLNKLSNLCKVICEWHFAQNSSLVLAKANYSSTLMAKLIGGIQVRRLIKATKKLDALVVLTKEDQKVWQRTNKNIVQIYNPSSYEVTELSDLMNRRFISVGRLEAQKGFEYLIQAWSKVYDKHPDYTLDIFGAGSLRGFLQDEIDRRHLAGVVTLKGSTNDIQSEYLTSSGFVMTSRFEGFPMVLLEASSFGLPLVSFDCVSGPKEIIRNGYNGYIVDLFDTDSLADSIIKIISDDELRVQMGKKAVEVVSEFSIKNIMHQWDTLFKRVVSK